METLESSETSTPAFCVSGARSENSHHEMPLFVFRDLLDAQLCTVAQIESYLHGFVHGKSSDSVTKFPE